MAISIFPSTAAEFVSNNFVVDMNDSTNNTADTGGVKQAGPYSMSFSSGDTSFDVYLIDDEGNSVGYSNSTSINASGLFSTVVILGVAQDEIISFNYQGSINNADGEGDEPGAGAYLESISPTDLPSIDDTATVTGGNFGADTEITFESGATVLPAKSITVVSGTELLVTRPDGLIVDNSPYTVKAVTTGVPEPTGSNANLLVDEVTSGAVPSWVTTSPLATAQFGSAYTDTLEATDADGAVTYAITSGSLPTGLSLNSSTGVISGTPTGDNQTFTATATDDGGNASSREFTLLVLKATGGTVTNDNNFTYHTFTSTDDFEALTTLTNAEYIIIAGGGGGSRGGGGAGGLVNGTATISQGSYTATIGAGGGSKVNGNNSSLATIATSTGGGAGGDSEQNGSNGGSGGGSGITLSNTGEIFGGSGTAGQGNDGGGSGPQSSSGAGGGGGAGQAGQNGFPDDSSSTSQDGGDGGDGLQFSDFASATSTGVDGGYYAGGAGGRTRGKGEDGAGGLGGGGTPDGVQSGVVNTGGGGARDGGGGSGLIMVRYS